MKTRSARRELFGGLGEPASAVCSWWGGGSWWTSSALASPAEERGRNGNNSLLVTKRICYEESVKQYMPGAVC